MEKPLKNWTLREIKKYCGERKRCAGCRFYDNEDGANTCYFVYGAYPEEWQMKGWDEE